MSHINNYNELLEYIEDNYSDYIINKEYTLLHYNNSYITIPKNLNMCILKNEIKKNIIEVDFRKSSYYNISTPASTYYYDGLATLSNIKEINSSEKFEETIEFLKKQIDTPEEEQYRLNFVKSKILEVVIESISDNIFVKYSIYDDIAILELTSSYNTLLPLRLDYKDSYYKHYGVTEDEFKDICYEYNKNIREFLDELDEHHHTYKKIIIHKGTVIVINLNGDGE